jgi:Viral (Superfamily 1) RNA helicase
MQNLSSLLVFLATFGAAQVLAAGDPENPDWPCIQRKVPSISAATVWDGPEIPNDDKRWLEQVDIADLVRKIASRRMSLDEAYAAIDGFAATLGNDRNEKLTILFAGVLQTINAERSEIMQGLERYSRRQKELAERIKSERAELDALRAEQHPGEEQTVRMKDLEQAFQWDTRVFEERRGSLSYVCETPVLLEQRMFSLARHIASLLE